jgi:hypothetical protein
MKCFGPARYVVDDRITTMAKHVQSQMAKRQPKNSAMLRCPCNPNISNRTEVGTTSTMTPTSTYTYAIRERRPLFDLASEDFMPSTMPPVCNTRVCRGNALGSP